MLNGLFFLASYELVAQEDGQVMIAKLVKQTEETANGLAGNLARKTKKGFAGTIELYVYDREQIELFKKSLGKEITINIRV